MSQTAQPDASQPQHNRALQRVEGLVGDWNMILSNSSFLPNPSDTVTGPVSFAWVQDGAWLLMRMGDQPPGPPAAMWLIARDEATPQYTMLYYDARGVSRVYAMSFDDDGVWKMWREAPGCCQRFEGTVSPDGQTITAHWEKSFDGTTWEHDFDVAYTKLR